MQESSEVNTRCVAALNISRGVFKAAFTGVRRDSRKKLAQGQGSGFGPLVVWGFPKPWKDNCTTKPNI